jgi:hypothetical protein
MHPKANYPLIGAYLLLFVCAMPFLPTGPVLRTPAAITSSMTCSEIVNVLLDPKTKIVRNSMERFNLSFKYQKKYTNLFLDSGLEQDELEVLLNSLESLPRNKKSLDLLEEYFGFTTTQFSKQKKKTLSHASTLFDGSYLESPKFKNFRNRQRKFASFKEKSIQKELKKIVKEPQSRKQKSLKSSTGVAILKA